MVEIVVTLPQMHSKGAAVAMVVGLLSLPVPAQACSPIPADISPSSSDIRWNVTIKDAKEALPDSCQDAVHAALLRLVAKQRIELEIVTRAEAPGSVSVELAQLSALAEKFRLAFDRHSGKTRIKIETQLLPALGTDRATSSIGRIVLRLVRPVP